MTNIKLNKELDYDTYQAFNDLCFSGLDFGEEIRSIYPELSIDNYKQFIDAYYEKHEAEMIKIQDSLNEIIGQKMTRFFASAEKIFGKNYSQNEYMGYLSIFYCNPRFLHNNTFQIYYKSNKNELLQTVFHEILHFIFFDYCKRNIPETENLDCNAGPLWKLSEIIDVLILNSKEFQQILNKKNELCYPGLMKKLEIIKNIWDRNLSIADFIKESLLELSCE